MSIRHYDQVDEFVNFFLHFVPIVAKRVPLAHGNARRMMAAKEAPWSTPQAVRELCDEREQAAWGVLPGADRLAICRAGRPRDAPRADRSGGISCRTSDNFFV